MAIDWLEEAFALEDQIWAQTRRTPGGELVWLHPASLLDPAGQKARLGPNLYDGVTGVALFLAAAEHVTGSQDRRELILQALSPVRHQLARLLGVPASDREPGLKLGAVIGLGGYMYGFLLMSRWLAEPRLLEEAAALATLFTADQIAADECLDVMHGCAGAVLALLALDRALPRALREMAMPAERAVACGEHLLRQRISVDGQPRAWPANGNPPSCGFGHGATGIAYALARLFDHTGETRYRDAAAEALAFEHLRYSPEHGNWPLLTASSQESFVVAWCHGAAGIGLGRIQMLAFLESPELREEARSALRTTMTCGPRARDFLCCGEMGKAEVLLEAHEVLGEPDLLEGAARIAARVVAQSRERGGRYRWFEPEDPRFEPSFFRGAAGVGYSMLRLADPASLPCVLSLEGLDAPC